MNLITGRTYSRDEIQDVVGGGDKTSFLPHRNKRVLCGCFTLTMNPGAPEKVDFGDGQEARIWAKRLVDTGNPIPIFIKQAENKWEYVGHFRAIRLSMDGSDLLEARQRRMDAIGTIFFEKADIQSTIGSWDNFVELAKPYYQGPGGDSVERIYKLEIAARLAAAREAVIAGNPEWPALLRKAFAGKNNLVHFITQSKFLRWMQASPDKASARLRALWDGPGDPVDRLSDFFAGDLTELLESFANRTTLGSFLLMALGAEQFPVYKATPFNEGRELAGLPQTPPTRSESECYRAALSFLDQILSECQKRNLPLLDRLDAQCLLWNVTYIRNAETGFRGWLFQANPKIWNLKTNLETMRAGDKDTWSVSRFGDQMRDGDSVVLWQGGAEAGIYALGSIHGAVTQRSTPDRADKGEATKETCIYYELEQILRPPLLKSQLEDHPILKDLSVIRGPQGTNFKVTEQQWKALINLVGDQKEAFKPNESSLEEIHRRVSATGLKISERNLRRFHLALQSRGFVVLCGISGTGKTWLAEAYADAIRAEVCLVPVAPNWTSNEDLIGYFNPLDKLYHDTEFSRFLRRAAAAYAENEDSPKPYVLILDEMNLARAEHYFAKFLSAMERRQYGDPMIELGPDDAVQLPPNLSVVGTVNFDETTHGFSNKVYDRAQVIELDVDRDQVVEHVGNVPWRDALLSLWDAVAEAAPFGFRVIDDVSAYITEAALLGTPWDQALDEQIAQKILPKLNGADVGQALDAILALTRDSYPLSHAKLKRMHGDFQRHGFASYF
jgi:MoxR-like ATPase